MICKAPPDQLDSAFAFVSKGWPALLRLRAQVKRQFIEALGLNDEQNYAKIPCINDMAIADMAKPFSLVRYRGLVQDVFEPEIYAAAVEEHDTVEAQQAQLINYDLVYTRPSVHQVSSCLQQVLNSTSGRSSGPGGLPLPLGDPVEVPDGRRP